jgi:hypothetical protein
MNFNAFGIKATMTAAVLAGVMAIGQMPAQAASIAGKTFSFYGSARLLSETDATTTLDFIPSYYAPNNDGQAEVSYASAQQGLGAYSQMFQIKDIPLAKTLTGWSLTGGPLTWIDISQNLGFGYILNAFNMTKTANNSFEAMIDGLFTPENLGTIDGSFSSQKRLATLIGTSFSAEMTAANGPVGSTPVPTPALLPGLLGLGATAWRKRQSKSIASI